MRRLALVLLVCLLWSGVSLGAWYDKGWLYRVQITIQASEVDATLTDFPVYVDLDDMADHFFAAVESTGDDIRITTSDEETEVPVQVVAIDTSAKTGELYFKGTLSSSADSVFWVYYGAVTDQSMPAADATYGSENVWNSGYLGVYHLQEARSTAADNYKDATSNASHGQLTDADSDTVQGTGKFGKAVDFSGDSNPIDFIDVGALAITGDATLSVWANAAVVDGDTIMAWGNWLTGGAGNYGVWWYDDYNDNQLIFLAKDGQGHTNSYGGAWHLVTGVRSGTTSIIYVDGVQLTPDKTGLAATTNTGVSYHIGAAGTATWDTINGLLDEARASDVARSADWIAAEFTNQSATTTFYAVGTFSQAGGTTIHQPADLDTQLTLENGATNISTVTYSAHLDRWFLCNQDNLWSLKYNGGTWDSSSNWTVTKSSTANNTCPDGCEGMAFLDGEGDGLLYVYSEDYGQVCSVDLSGWETASWANSHVIDSGDVDDTWTGIKGNGWEAFGFIQETCTTYTGSPDCVGGGRFLIGVQSSARTIAKYELAPGGGTNRTLVSNTTQSCAYNDLAGMEIDYDNSRIYVVNDNGYAPDPVCVMTFSFSTDTNFDASQSSCANAEGIGFGDGFFISAHDNNGSTCSRISIYEDSYCGDNYASAVEACDGDADTGDHDGNDCTDFGYTSGTLACESDCSAFDTSGCYDTLYVDNSATVSTPCTTGTPCKPSLVWASVSAGDTVVYKDGTYTGADYMISPPCTTDGSLGSEISVECENDGACRINGEGVRTPVDFEQGANDCDYYDVHGFNIHASNDSVFEAKDSTHIRVYRVVAWDAGDWNSKGFQLGDYSLMEDCAAFGVARKQINSYDSSNTTVRRLWARWEGATETGAPSTMSSYYESTGRLYENVLLTWDGGSMPASYYIHNGDTIVSGPRTTISNPRGVLGFGQITPGSCADFEMKGSISYVMDHAGVTEQLDTLGSRWVLGLNNATNDANKGCCLTLENVVTYVDPNESAWDGMSGFSLGGAACATQPIDIIDATSIAQQADDIDADWDQTDVEHATSVGALGDNIYEGDGAHVCYRYEDGSETAIPLWPWPMQDRIFDATTLAADAGHEHHMVECDAADTPDCAPVLVTDPHAVADVMADIVSMFGQPPVACGGEAVSSTRRVIVVN